MAEIQFSVLHLQAHAESLYEARSPVVTCHS